MSHRPLRTHKMDFTITTRKDNAPRQPDFAFAHAGRSASVSRSPHPRVLLVTPQPFFEERGTPIAVALTARALSEAGYKVDLLAFPVGADLAIPGVRIERCNNPFGIEHVPVGFSVRKLALDASLLRAFARLLAQREYHVVHAVEEAAWLAAELCPPKGIPFVYDMASSIPEQLAAHPLFGNYFVQKLLRGAERRVIERAAHVVCSGGLGARVCEVSPHADVTEWRFPVVQQAADPRDVSALRAQHRIPASGRVLLYAGNFSGYQGIDLMLEGFARAAAQDPQLHLVCVGASDADEATRVEQRLPSALRARVRVLPRDKRAMMPAWFEVADCLMSLRTQGNNIPLKIFEYMAARKPIVASSGPAHEPLLNDRRAYLCTADVENVAGAIGRVFADPTGSRRVANAAGDYASRHFSWPGFQHLVNNIYDRVLRPPGPCALPSAFTRN
jgi:glycosyltransferase involved in cell wall biosynthesis